MIKIKKVEFFMSQKGFFRSFWEVVKNTGWEYTSSRGLAGVTLPWRYLTLTFGRVNLRVHLS